MTAETRSGRRVLPAACVRAVTLTGAPAAARAPRVMLHCARVCMVLYVFLTGVELCCSEIRCTLLVPQLVTLGDSVDGSKHTTNNSAVVSPFNQFAFASDACADPI